MQIGDQGDPQFSAAVLWIAGSVLCMNIPVPAQVSLKEVYDGILCVMHAVQGNDDPCCQDQEKQPERQVF